MRLIILPRRTLILAAILALTVLMGIVMLIIARDALPVLQVSSLAEGERRIPIYSVQTDERKVALTFDATWGAEFTDRLLAALGDNDVRATFFLTNIWMKDYPEKTGAIWAAGHEIGLHSADHHDMATLSEDDIRQDLDDNRRQLISICADAKPVLFRPPYGSYNDRLMQVAEDELGLRVIQWSIDSLDWREVTPEYVYNRIVTLLHPGAIILFHNNAEPTAEALERIISYLHDNGYEIVPVSELLHPEPYTVDHRGQQVPQ